MKNVAAGVFVCIVAVFLGACGDSRSHSEVTSETNVGVAATGVHANDLALDRIMEVVTSGAVTDAASLEQWINTTPGVNNVDADGDGTTDPIGVKEVHAQQGYAFALVAQTTSTNGQETVDVAQVNITVNQTTNDVEVSGGYESHIGGYEDHYYHSHGNFSVGDALFLSWLLRPHPVYLYSPYHTYGWYAPRPVLYGGALSSARTSYTSTQTRISPVKQSRPSTFTTASSVSGKKASRFATPRAQPTAQTVSAQRGQSKSFGNRGTNTPQTTASGFGAGRKQPASPSSSSSSWSKPKQPPASSSASGSRKSSSSSRSSSSRNSSRRR